MESIEIKKAGLADLITLKELSYETFKTAFWEDNDPEDMETYLKEAFSEAKVKEELSNPNSFFYLVKKGIKDIGYFKLNIGDAQSEHIENAIELERIYTLAEYQGKGIGQMMMNQVFEIASQFNKEKLWLGVWGENKGAIRFYQRNGFQKFGEHSFFLGKDEQFDDLMEVSLKDEKGSQLLVIPKYKV